MSRWRTVPSTSGLAFENFTVHLASVSFWAAFAGSSGQISSAVLPDLIASFSPSLLRCLGAATRVASTICPPLARYPDFERCLSKRANRLLIARACTRCSRKSQIVLASGTLSPRLSPRNRRNESRSLITNSAV
jgi:hypothetical protein